MTSLLLIRHAETDMAGTFCGHSNLPVNAAGRAQIITLLNRLRDEPLEAIYTSDLQRAAITADAIANSLHLPCFVRPALREIDFGRWEGLHWDQIESAEPAFAAEWLRSFPNLPAPEGEPFAEFEIRVLAEAAFLFNQTQFENVAVVAHAGVMRTLIRHFAAADESDAWQVTKPYCAVVRLPPHPGQSIAVNFHQSKAAHAPIPSGDAP
jgi:alpha-ribazole phosphatase